MPAEIPAALTGSRERFLTRPFRLPLRGAETVALIALTGQPQAGPIIPHAGTRAMPEGGVQVSGRIHECAAADHSQSPRIF